MGDDPDLLQVRRALRAALVTAWALLGLPVVFGGAYLPLSADYGTPVAARVPIIVGYVFLLAAAALQVLIAAWAGRTFPRVPGLRAKALGAVAGTGIAGFVIAAAWSLTVQLLTGDRDSIGSPFLFVCAIGVLAPVTAMLFDAGAKIARVDAKYGPTGTTQLLQYQEYAAAPARTASR